MKSHQDSFLNRIRRLEEELFPNELDPDQPSRIKSDEYSWLYRPSHHIKTGLVTEADVDALINGKKLLSIGACPAHFERLLLALGVPATNIVIADSNPDILALDTPMQKVVFDCTKEWPQLGHFDLIIFPESLCIALTDTIKQENISDDGQFPTDAREAELLTHVIVESLSRLAPEGEIRANGPMSHPNVWKSVKAALDEAGFPHTVDYHRYFVSVRRS